MASTREHIERHGKPVAFYSDRHSVFRRTRAVRGDGRTHFSRAMDLLNIEIICANSPQAKGRVERANATLQDRLVKAMRLAGIATIEEANTFLPHYLAAHNQRFARMPLSSTDLHRPLAVHDDLDAAMVWCEERTLSRALTLFYNKAMFILDPNQITMDLAGKKVVVCEYPDGRVDIQHEGQSLPCRVFDKIQPVSPPAVVGNDRLDAALAMARMMQENLPLRHRNRSEPSRKSQPRHPFPSPEEMAGGQVRSC